MNSSSSILNLKKLPSHIQQQLWDYYHFLLNKYSIRKQEEVIPNKNAFLNSVKRNRYSLPKSYRFNRDWANER